MSIIRLVSFSNQNSYFTLYLVNALLSLTLHMIRKFLSPECIRDEEPTGAGYRGNISVTVSGRICQPWLESTPNSHSYDRVTHRFHLTACFRLVKCCLLSTVHCNKSSTLSRWTVGRVLGPTTTAATPAPTIPCGATTGRERSHGGKTAPCPSAPYGVRHVQSQRKQSFYF